MNNRFLLLSVFFIFNTYVNYAQQEYIKGKVVEIKNTNSFFIESTEMGKILLLQLNDTRSIPEGHNNYKDAINYLATNILNKEVYYIMVNKKNDVLNVSVIYNCVPDEGDLLGGPIPCLSANFLDLEMINKKYVEYVGSNIYFKQQ